MQTYPLSFLRLTPVAALGAVALFGCLESATPPPPAVDSLLGAWEVVNGTRRETCPEGEVTAPFRVRVWFHGEAGAPISRADEGSSCELRFGSFLDDEAGEAGARILPGQSCDEVVLDPGGDVGERTIYPVSWEVRPLPGELLWESYELLMVERLGKVERVCRVSAAATLARPGPPRR